MLTSDKKIHSSFQLPTQTITQATLDSMNVEQARESNKKNLDDLGGVDILAASLGTNLHTGLTKEQVLQQRTVYGENSFPETRMDTYLELLLEAFQDTTLLVLLAAACVSLALGIYEHGAASGWIEGGAILIACFLVANIGAGNDYSKQLQFKALEAASAEDERCSVLRDGMTERINPRDIVVGDVLVLQAGDSIPADAIVFDNNTVLSNESTLTGEPDDLKKSKHKDPFLLSSCLITEAEESHALVIGIGVRSQWGKIKANLVSEAVNTPLQDKLEIMTMQIGYVGIVFAIGTFIALIVQIWTLNGGKEISAGIVGAFIQGVTIIVVAIPEGLPLAVTIALAYSTKKMYADKNFIRVLAACETMGNATTICSDKTGTLTENRMTVVEGWFSNVKTDQESFKSLEISQKAKNFIMEQSCINRLAYLIYKDQEGKKLERPQIIGNKTEGALIEMVASWGYDYEAEKNKAFREAMGDRCFAFNSGKKRSTCVLHRDDGTVTLYCKGASEWIIKDCNKFTDKDGSPQPLDDKKRKELDEHINYMANQALRTLCLAHKQISKSDLPLGWEENNPPDNFDLVLDCIVGIIDPLRSDVRDAVATAQRAGVIVRMVTGDNIDTAKAIAKQCGILREGGKAVEGPVFRDMSPADVDAMLPDLRVMGRSSPDDKYLLVTRLNGHNLPKNKEEWLEKNKHRGDVTWENDRDKYLPGYSEEWEASRPHGGQVVGVTGDGTNDAPALKAADVGLAMGITGTKVAQGASDIVILDDKFSSIVRAIMWGRAVYDNIRKFLQFQLTVNVVALILVFVGACAGFEKPLNAVQMLWVNLVMDTMGALALATESPTPELLERLPYKRTAGLISRPMIRNILGASIFQLIALFVLLFKGPDLFGVHPMPSWCSSWSRVKTGGHWNLFKGNITYLHVNCESFKIYCPDLSGDCFESTHFYPLPNSTSSSSSYQPFVFKNLSPSFAERCLKCETTDYTHGAIIFNAFIMMQFFNLFTARNIFDDYRVWKGLTNNGTFIVVAVIIFGFQVLWIFVGGEFFKVSPLNGLQWGVTIAIGAASFLWGMLVRFIPFPEAYEDFHDNMINADGTSKALKPLEII